LQDIDNYCDSGCGRQDFVQRVWCGFGFSSYITQVINGTCWFTYRDTIDEDTRRISAALLEQEQYRYLTDFDNHLDNVANDWRNVKLNDLISRCS